MVWKPHFQRLYASAPADDLLTHLGIAERHKYAFLLASLVITVLLAEIFDRCTGAIYSKIWKTKKPEIKRQTADTSA